MCLPPFGCIAARLSSSYACMFPCVANLVLHPTPVLPLCLILSPNAFGSRPSSLSISSLLRSSGRCCLPGGGGRPCPSYPYFVREKQSFFAYMRRNLTGDELAQLDACFGLCWRGACTVYWYFTGHMRMRARHLVPNVFRFCARF